MYTQPTTPPFLPPPPSFFPPQVWDDRSLHNIDFSVLCPMFTLREINHLEKKFLELLDYDVCPLPQPSYPHP